MIRQTWKRTSVKGNFRATLIGSTLNEGGVIDYRTTFVGENGPVDWYHY